MNGKTNNYQKASEPDMTIATWIQHIGDPSAKAANDIFHEIEDSEFSDFTGLDLFGTSAFSFKELKEKLYDLLKINKNTKNINKHLPQFNLIYKSSIDYIERILYRKAPKGLKEKTWGSLDEFIVYVQNHTNRDIDGAYSVMFCAIMKIMLVEIELINKANIIDSLDQDIAMLREKVESITGFELIKNKNDDDYKGYQLDGVHTGKMEDRPKSIDSIRTKMIYNRKYDSVDKFQDLLAMRFELSNSTGQSGYVHTILRLKAGLYDKLPGDYDVTLQIKGNILSEESINILRNNRINVKEPPFKGSSSLEYEDAKFIGGKVRVGKNRKGLSPEIQFVLPGNKNEAGFSNHSIYDFKKILSANARLFGTITLWHLEDMLSKYKTPIDPRAILAHLLYPQEGKSEPFLYLLRAQSTLNNQHKTYFSTSDVYDVKKGEKLVTMKNLYDKFPKIEDFSESNTTKFAQLVHQAIDTIMMKKGQTKSLLSSPTNL